MIHSREIDTVENIIIKWNELDTNIACNTIENWKKLPLI